MIAFNKTLGKFQLVGIPPAPRGIPQVEVSFDIDANGIINVSAKDLGTGNEQQIRIEGGSGLTEDDVERMIKDAESHADEAHKLRELADARNLGEQLAYQTERTLAEHRDKLDEAEASTIEGRVMELRQAVEGSDVADIQSKTDALQEASRSLADAIYAQAVGGAGGLAAVRQRRRRDRGRGRRGRRLRGHRRGGGGEAVVTDQPLEPVETERQEPRARRPRPLRLDDLLARARRRAGRVPRPRAARAGRLDNYRKRALREQERLVAHAHERLVKELLPILDDLERALEAAEKHEEATLVDGVKLVAAVAAQGARRRRASRRSRPRARSTRTCTRRCSRSPATAPSRARCSRSSSAATGSATASSGPRR